MVSGPKQQGDTEMRTRLKTLIIASTLVAGIAAAPVLYSAGTADAPDSGIAPMGQGGMMGQGNTLGRGSMQGHGSMMGQGNMQGQGNTLGRGSMQGHGNMMGMMMTDQMIEAHDKMMKAMMEAHGAAPSDKK
jgi:hypothetical protein